ncbi:MAG: low specificity L-threonine aldolase, partial [Alphaproteobacteria bacterium]|nr:low specificity L-threonine aldolase [Alphaproteobacteria bacterium]
MGACPEILAAIVRANAGETLLYGLDQYSQGLDALYGALFGTEVRVFPVITGTAANALSVAALLPPYGAVYCHDEAHMMVSECGAPEFYGGGAKLVPLPGRHGRIAPETLAAALDEAGFGRVHSVQPAALSISQLTEGGTAYRPAKVAALADIAHRHGLKVHMDGARFANAVAHLGCRPADITWRAGVDVLSLGATKNGALAADAVVFFDPALAAAFPYLRKRGGHLLSRGRVIACQLEAYAHNDLWLTNARHANAMAARLSAAVAGAPGVVQVHPCEGNQLFLSLATAAVDALERDGFVLHRFPEPEGRVRIRLVTAFNTTAAAVDALAAAIWCRAGSAA